MNKQLLALYGLKWDPFSPELPIEAVHPSAAVENFAWRIEHALVREGGFALISGDVGTGKSVALRLIAERLALLPDLSVAALTRPSANLADFYRELGELFAVELKPHNRWMGFKNLRARWLEHLDHTRLRPVLLIDEAQQVHPSVLSELRLLASAQFDSRRAAHWRPALDRVATQRRVATARLAYPRALEPGVRQPRGVACLSQTPPRHRRQARPDDRRTYAYRVRPRDG